MDMSQSMAASVRSLSPDPPWNIRVAPDCSVLMIQAAEAQAIPMEATLEVKTRSRKRPMAIDEALREMLVSQTPNLVRAHHWDVLSEQPAVDDVSSNLKGWENAHQADLEKFCLIAQAYHLRYQSKWRKGRRLIWPLAR
ncbi:hypothetical protein BDW68DRAFT_57502 [Aspergillus falconensis]